VKALENEIEELQAQLQKEECCNCKARLGQRHTGIVHQENSVQILKKCIWLHCRSAKQKHDKIEALEMCSAPEISNQKKEERLLSPTIYEPGLTLMQQKLKHGQ
jgi:ferredoxin-fold anticodon binding domain-containing protein